MCLGLTADKNVIREREAILVIMFEKKNGDECYKTEKKNKISKKTLKGLSPAQGTRYTDPIGK